MSSSAQGLRELTNEISSLLSEGGIRLAPQHNGRDSPPSFGYHSYNIPTLVPPSDTKHATSSPLLSTSGVSLSQHNSLPSTSSGTSLSIDTAKENSFTVNPNEQGQGQSPLTNEQGLGQSLLNNEQGLGQSPLTNEQGLGQSPLIARPLFAVNGGSPLSSRSQSRSSLLQLPGDTVSDETRAQIKVR